ncbi:hypothetical protein MMC22_004070 [Lobaria immixta]|nr:hypothetical protein [Lobaria immixta]
MAPKTGSGRPVARAAQEDPRIFTVRKVEDLGLQGSSDHKTELEDLNGNPLKICQSHAIPIGTIDNNDFEVIQEHEFLGLDLPAGIDMVLGLPWLPKANPDIHFGEGGFSHRTSHHRGH